MQERKEETPEGGTCKSEANPLILLMNPMQCTTKTLTVAESMQESHP
jgi:hypothetical protein